MPCVPPVSPAPAKPAVRKTTPTPDRCVAGQRWLTNRLCRCIGDRATSDRGSEEIESCGFTVTPGQRIPQSEGSMVIYYLIFSAAKGVAG